MDADRAGREIEILPLQGEGLTEAQSRARQQKEEDLVVPGDVLSRLEEVGELLPGHRLDLLLLRRRFLVKAEPLAEPISRIRRQDAVVHGRADQDFLKKIWDRLPPAERKCLKLERVGQRDTSIVELDIEEATQALYKAQQKVLLDYYHDNKRDPRDVVQKIRPVLETYCTILGGALFADNDTLGLMIRKIRNAGAGHQLFPLCDDLEDLNEYTKRYHHGENPDAATEQISDAELQGKVRLTLELTGGC